MKNQITSKILKFAFAFLFILTASSCSEDNDAMDAAALAQENAINETLAKGAKETPTAFTETYSSSITWDNPTEPVCIDTEITFTLSGWIGTQELNVKIYDAITDNWVSIDSFNGAKFLSPQSLSYTFNSEGVYNLKYQVSGSPANGGTQGFIDFNVTAENCAPCTESESDTAYAGNGTGGTDSGNKAWWYYLDIADGSSDVTADVWRGKSNDIGDVSYNASTKMITITLDDWFLETDNSESVKWYSYADGALPTNGRPIPGQAPYKGTSLTFSASTDRYYAIHLDVATCE